MNKEEASKLIRAGKASVWNKYRQDNPDWKPDLSYEDLSDHRMLGDNLYYFNLNETNLCGTKFSKDRKWITKSIENAIFNADTVFPVSVDPIKYGAVFVTAAQLKRTDFCPIPTVFITLTPSNYREHIIPIFPIKSALSI